MSKIWYENENVDKGVIISSRVRLARNLLKYKFPNSFSNIDAKNIIEDIESAMMPFFGYNLTFPQPIDNISRDYLNYYSERHIISRNMVESKHSRAIMKDGSQNLSIMINEEDHLRIQYIKAGENLERSFKSARRIDDLLSERLDFAFDYDFGYLTSCPTNAGTGLRASYMIHIPVLEHTNNIKEYTAILGKNGLTLRGSHGEGSDAVGSIYQISNQTTLGKTEEDIIEILNKTTFEIVQKEMELRDKLMKTIPIEVEDRVYIAYGILCNSRRISLDEAMRLLSHIRFGIQTGLMENISKNTTLYKLMLDIQPASLQHIIKKAENEYEIDKIRADYLRDNIIS